MASDDLAPGYYDDWGTWHRRVPRRELPPLGKTPVAPRDRLLPSGFRLYGKTPSRGERVDKLLAKLGVW
jgi:hypothetical protein